MSGPGSRPDAGRAGAAAPLVVERLTRRFGDLVAVDGIDLRVGDGAVFGLLGPDGAGKSTLLRMLATVLDADDGDARVFGASVRTDRARVTPRIGYMPQRFCMYPDLTVSENLEFFATIRGVGRAQRRERAARLLQGMGLAPFTRRQAGLLSGGMKQKLMLASTLMHSPDLLLLDEPTTGVDPVSRREFWEILAGLRAERCTVLVATPYMDEAERCTDIAFMDTGRIRHSGTPAQILGLVPGVLVEVAAPSPRAALAAIAGTDGIASAHLYGDVVRVLVSDRGGVDDASRARAAERLVGERLAAAAGTGPAGATVAAVDVDMEAAFAALAELGVAGEPARTGGSP